MNTLDDEYIASTMRLIGETGGRRDNAVQQIMEGVTRRRATGRAVRVTGAVAGTGLLVAAFAGGVQLRQPQGPEVSTVTVPKTPVAWEALTGKALGDALGLQGGPSGTVAVACNSLFVEYDDHEGVCLDPAVLEAAGITTRFDRDLVLWQITGLERSPKLVELVYSWEEFEDLQAPGTADLERRADLWRQLSALRQEIEADQ